MDKDSFQWESDEKNFDERDVKDLAMIYLDVPTF